MSTNIILTHKTRINILYGDLKNMLEWCKQNCTGDWKYDQVGDSIDDYTYNAISGTMMYDFYFETDRDYFAFIMWKK